MTVFLLRPALTALLLSTAALPALAETAAPSATEATTHAGALVLADGFSRATRPGAPVAGGFVTITNTSNVDDRLVAAASPVAGAVQLHEMAMKDGAMTMRELADGLPLPAGETVTLKPGGYHLMFMDLKQPLVEGGRVEVTLTFAQAGTVTIPLAILAPDAKGFADGH